MNRRQILPISATALGSMTTRRKVLRGLAGASALALMSPSLCAAATQACSTRKLWTLMGNFPHTRLFNSGALTSPCITLDIAPERVVFAAFARTVAMEFDISELSLVTFLQAKAAGRKLSLMPAVNMSRFQHPYLV
jgi:4,5-dihydroxyphthalate decarboxylase